MSADKSYISIMKSAGIVEMIHLFKMLFHLYTLIETYKLNDLLPMGYFAHVFRQLMKGNKGYECLLPGILALKTI